MSPRKLPTLDNDRHETRAIRAIVRQTTETQLAAHFENAARLFAGLTAELGAKNLASQDRLAAAARWSAISASLTEAAARAGFGSAQAEKLMALALKADARAEANIRAGKSLADAAHPEKPEERQPFWEAQAESTEDMQADSQSESE